MKKKFILLISLILPLFVSGQDNYCDPTLADEVNNYISKNGGEWLKDFNIFLPQSSQIANNPVASYKMVLSANTVYRFLITSSAKYKGDAHLTLEDKYGKLIVSISSKSKTIPEPSDFKINTTDTYTIKINFKDGSEGCALFTVCYLKKQT
jgi:hypothetical protein